MPEAERNPSPDKKNVRDDYDNSKAATPAPLPDALAINQDNSQKQKRDSEEIRDEKFGWRKHVTWSNFLATVIAGSAVITAGTSWWQGHATSQQYRAMVDQLGIMQFDGRAWLTVEEPPPTKRSDGEPPEFYVVMKNVGRSPGTIIQHSILPYFPELGDPELVVGGPVPQTMVDFNVMLKRLRDDASNYHTEITIAPNGEYPSAIPPPIKGGDPRIEKIDKGTRVPVIYSLIVYKDTWGKLHESWGCFLYIQNSEGGRWVRNAYFSHMD